jgi:hypothetical protein
MDIVHERKVNIAAAADTCFGIQFWNVINAYLNQIAGTQAEDGIAAVGETCIRLRRCWSGHVRSNIHWP